MGGLTMKGEGRQGHLPHTEPPHAISRRERIPSITCLHPERTIPGYLHNGGILEYTCPKCPGRELLFVHDDVCPGTICTVDTRCCQTRVHVHVRGYILSDGMERETRAINRMA